MKRLIFTFICISLALVASGYYATYIHERAHQEIYLSDGINSTIAVHLDGSGDTTAEQGCISSECKLSQLNNEVVGYHAFVIGMILMIGFIGVMFFLVVLIMVLRGVIEP